VHSTKLSRLLATTDGSEVADHAVVVAQQLAARAGAQLEVLSVETVGLPALVPSGNGTRHASPLNSVHWARGIPGLEITHRARAWGADLVVLGRDPRRPADPLPLGRTADTVVRRRDGPCLLVPPTVGKLERVVMALDGTSRGLGVLETTTALVRALNAKLHAVHVLPEHTPATASEQFKSDPAVQRIRDALAGFPLIGGPASLQVLQGSPVWEILAFLERTGADLLVLGVRGGGPTGEMGSGHIGQDLLRTAPVAILTVPI
jgi:nucleotide-binding universal stress UspA family protein